MSSLALIHRLGAVCASIMLCAYSSAASREPITVYGIPSAQSLKSAGPSEPTRSKGIAAIGDNVANPFIIGALPYADTGTTVGFADDYSEICPFPGTGAPDAVYAFTPATDTTITIELCGSAYDTKAYVYASTVTPGAPLACGDDYCGPFYLQSRLGPLLLTAGVTYYIIIDGYGAAAGDYILHVDAADPCLWAECPAGALAEGEPCTTAPDTINGGCGAAQPRYRPIGADPTICGQLWASAGVRDLDWYTTSLKAGAQVRWTVAAEFPASTLIYNITNGCTGLVGLRYDAHACDSVDALFEAPSTGLYAFVVTTREQYAGLDCAAGPWEYTCRLEYVCACDCAHDPGCDGVTNVLDVTLAVNIAFRGAVSVPDPHPACPWQPADVTCDGVVTVLDVASLVNVAFRGGNPASLFCDPCP